MSRKVTRRDFLKVGTLGIASAVLAGCQNPRRWVVLEPYVKPPEEQLAGVATWYASTCRQCPSGCGILVRTMNGRALKIEGNPEHPLNRGKLCARGQAGPQLLYNPDRLPGPVLQDGRGTRKFRQISWEEAINTLFTKLQGAGSGVAVWGGSTISGHLYDLFQRFNQALGAPAPLVYDLYSEMNGYHLLAEVSQSLFGEGALPGYDVGSADVVFSFGANFLGTGLSAVRYGVGFGDFRSQPDGGRGYLVQFEPRMSITGAKADCWLPIRPGSEGLVAQAILRLIADQNLGPAERVKRAQALAADVDLNSVAAASEISIEELGKLARIFATAKQPLAIPGAALTGQSNATSAVTAVQALNVVASTSDQSSGMSLSQRLPQSSLVKPAVSSYADAQKMIESMKSGEVQVLMVYSANPAYELPDKAGFTDAVSSVPFVVSFSSIVDETSLEADLILPEPTYLEAWGFEVVSPNFGVPVVSSQQPVVTPLLNSRSAGDVLLTVARGIPAAAKALPWEDEVAFLKEEVTKLPPGASGGSSPDVLWARFLQHGGWWPEKAQASSPSSIVLAKVPPAAASQFQGTEQEYPYYLQPYLSDLLSDGRGANQPWLQGSPDPMTTIGWQTWVELHPDTASKLGVRYGDIVKVLSPQGELEAPVYIYPVIRPDTVGVPLGQGHSDYGRYAQDRGSNVMKLIGVQTDDTGSGLAWSTLRVTITPTGKRVALAKFENTQGVNEGFINSSFPGQ